MADGSVTTQARSVVAQDVLDAFKASLRGRLIQPADKDYDEARKVWNGMIDRRPALIARCAGPADVLNAVRFAREHDLLVSVRGGGHNIAGLSVSEAGLMIDLSAMRGVRVNRARHMVRAEGGARLGDVDLETQAFGLATTLGVAPTTGVAGLTLGGGYGWLAGKYGMACDNLVSADVVTADGDLVTASESENPDLFWGLRGAGANFGVATSLEYRLHAVGTVLGGAVFYPLSRAKEVMRFYNEFAATAPDELTTIGAFLFTPDGQVAVGIAVCYCGDLDEGQRVVEPLRKIADPLVDSIQPMPYLALQHSFDALFAPGQHYYWKSSLTAGLGDGLIDLLAGRAAALPTPLSVIALQELPGAAARVPQDATAFPHRYHHWNVIFHAGWTEGDGAKNIAWARDSWEAAQPFVRQAAYVNDLGEEGADRVRAAYGPNYDRLAQLKQKYDPANFFRLNQNITPER